MASIKLSALEVTQGTPKVWHETAGTMSGTPNHRYFCGDCGSPLWAVFHEGSEVVDVMPALFEVDCGIVGEFFWKNAFGESPLTAGGNRLLTMSGVEWEKPMAPEGKVRETQ